MKNTFYVNYSFAVDPETIYGSQDCHPTFTQALDIAMALCQVKLIDYVCLFTCDEEGEPLTYDIYKQYEFVK